MTEKKITKAMILATIKANVENMNFDGDVTAEDVINYVDTTLAQAANRRVKEAERRATKKAENPVKGIVLDILTTEFMTGDEIVAGIEGDEISKAKVVSALSALIKDDVVEKTFVKVGTRKLTAYRIKSEE